MNRNWKRVSGAVAITIGGVLVSCGPAAIDTMGDAMVEAGQMLTDAADGMMSDAAGQDPLPIERSVPCDLEVQTVRTINENGSEQETWQRYATIEHADINPSTVRHATAFVCDFTTTSTPPAPAGCPAGQTECLNDPYAGRLRCHEVPAMVEDGRARVFCGNRYRHRTADVSGGMVQTSSSEYASVRFRIEI